VQSKEMSAPILHLLDDEVLQSLPKQLFLNLHVNRVVAVDEAYYEGLKSLGHEGRGAEGRKHINFR
jgi:hypothetical protein